MHLGKVIGTLTPCVIYEGMEGLPLLLVQPLNPDQDKSGSPFVAADPTRMCGKGELIYYESSREAALLCDPWFVPVDHAIVGIVDDVHLLESSASKKVTKKAKK